MKKKEKIYVDKKVHEITEGAMGCLLQFYNNVGLTTLGTSIEFRFVGSLS